MKIRNGFVSNSSSSSFIVALPKDWNPTDEQIIKADVWNDQTDNKAYISDIKNNIKKLNAGGEIYEYDNPVYSSISELIKKFIVLSIDTGPDDEGFIVNVASEKLSKKIIKLIASNKKEIL